MSYFDCPPDAESMLNSMRSLGYSFETALADVIDNSLAAEAKTVRLEAPLENPSVKPYLAIVDDGKGMTLDELKAAMKHACKNPNQTRTVKDLGRFGLGLKTASLSQCRELIVMSKKEGVINAASWNLDTVRDEKSWALKIFDDSQELAQLPYYDMLASDDFVSGTAVIWREFDRLVAREGEGGLWEAFDEQLEHAKEHLSLVYHMLLTDGNTQGKTSESEANLAYLTLYVRNQIVKPKDPFLERSEHGPSMRVSDTVELADSKVVIQGFTIPSEESMSKRTHSLLGLPNRTIWDDQGFYIYRNHRLINWGTWLGMGKKTQESKLTRIRVDIPNSIDHLWDLDIKKSTATPPKAVRDVLKKLMPACLATSKEVQNGKGRRLFRPERTPEETVNDLWVTSFRDEKTFDVSINTESGLYKSLTETMSSSPELLKMFKAYTSMLGMAYPSRWVKERYLAEQSEDLSEDEFNEVLKQNGEQLEFVITTLKGNRELVLSFLKGCDIFSGRPRATEELVEKLLKKYSERRE